MGRMMIAKRLTCGTLLLKSAFSFPVGNGVVQRPSLLGKALSTALFSDDHGITAEVGVTGDMATAVLCVPTASADFVRSELLSLVLGSQIILMSEKDDAACYIVFDKEDALKVKKYSLKGPTTNHLFSLHLSGFRKIVCSYFIF